MTAVLGPLILRHAEIKTSMEAVIVQHVLPEFQSQHAFMRYIVRAFPSGLSSAR
jgi:hypothetical protein